MNEESLELLIARGVLLILLVFALLVIVGLIAAAKNLFKGSGAPKELAKSLWAALQSSGHIVLATGAVGALMILMVAKVITSDAGLPLVASILGYVLAKPTVRRFEGLDTREESE